MSERYRLIVGDAVNEVRKMGGDIALCVTSPPYNVQGKKDYDVQEGNLDLMPWGDYVNYLENVLFILYEKLLPGGRVCLNIDDAFVSFKSLDNKYSDTYSLSTHARMIVAAERIGYIYIQGEYYVAEDTLQPCQRRREQVVGELSLSVRDTIDYCV